MTSREQNIIYVILELILYSLSSKIFVLKLKKRKLANIDSEANA